MIKNGLDLRKSIALFFVVMLTMPYAAVAETVFMSPTQNYKTLHDIVWIEKGNESMQKRDYEKAIFYYNASIRVDPTSAIAWICKGFSLCVLEKFNSSIECFNKAIEIDPELSIAWFGKGTALCALENYNESLECCNNAINITQTSPYPWATKGLALLSLNEPNESVVCCNKAIEIDPTLPSSWIAKGLALYALRKYNESIECSNKAINLNSELAIAWSVRCLALCSSGKRNEAYESYEKAMSLEPNSKLATILNTSDNSCFRQDSVEQNGIRIKEPLLKIQQVPWPQIISWAIQALGAIASALTIADWIEKHFPNTTPPPMRNYCRNTRTYEIYQNGQWITIHDTSPI